MERTALSQSLGDSLAQIREGLEISPELAVRLLACPDEQLPELLLAAGEVRNRFKAGVVTYSRKVFIPLTNLCRDYCGYCTFRRSPGDPGAHTMTPDEVLEVARAGERLGCREALFSLGDKPELAFPEMRDTLQRLGYRSTLHYVEAMCERVLRETGLIPHANPGVLSAAWLERLRAVSPSIGLMLESTSPALLRPGAAHDNAPDKTPALRLGTIEAAGRLGIPFTTGILIGIGESHQDRVDSLFAIRELHRRYGHIQEVIVQNFRVKPNIPMSGWPEPSNGDMLRTVAVARLILGDMNVQAPPIFRHQTTIPCWRRASMTGAGCRRSRQILLIPSGRGLISKNSSAGPLRRDINCVSGCRSIRSSCRWWLMRVGWPGRKLARRRIPKDMQGLIPASNARRKGAPSDHRTYRRYRWRQAGLGARANRPAGTDHLRGQHRG